MEPWIITVIQGYVEIRKLAVHSNNPPDVLQTRRLPRGSHGSMRRRKGSRRGQGEGGRGEEVEMVDLAHEKPLNDECEALISLRVHTCTCTY